MTTDQAKAVALAEKPKAWLYKGDPYYTGDEWRETFAATTDEQVAKFKDDAAVPLFTRQQVIEELARQSGVMPTVYDDDDGLGSWKSCDPTEVREACWMRQRRRSLHWPR